MNRKGPSFAGLFAAAALLLTLSSCARNQHLISIQVVPPGATFEGVGAAIQFRALGTYIHPPETKDITDRVQWSIDSQNLATVTNTGLVTAISTCGSGNVTASLNAPPNFVFGTAFVTGAGIGTAACNQALLTVNITGTGSVTSSTGGINCPGTCSAVFPLDSSVELTATPGTGGHTFGSWTGCSSTSNMCAVTMSGNVTVTATFN